MTRTLTLLLIIVALGACARGVTPLPDVHGDRAPRELSPDELDAIATLMRLEDHRRFHADTFRAITDAHADEVRRRAALAAGRVGDRSAVPFLLHLLGNDRSPAVRAEAAFALGLVGDTADAVIRALRAAAPTEWAPVREAETAVVVEVLATLGRLGTDAARREVVEALRRVHPALDPNGRRVAAEALLAVWRFPSGPGRANAALSFLRHPDPELRWRAAYALMRLGETAGTPQLLRLLEDGDAEPRAVAFAARGLTAARADSAGLRAEVAAALTRNLADRDPHVRINALRSLATFGDDYRDPIAERARDGDPHVAAAAADALGTLGAPVAPLLADLVGDSAVHAAARGAALARLAALDAARAAPQVLRWSEGPLSHRYAAARTLASLPWHHARPPLLRLVEDPDARVAIAATVSAATLAADSALAADARHGLRLVLLELLRAPDARVRTVALRGLAPIVLAGDLDLLLDAYAAAAADPDGRPAAIAAVRAIASLDTLAGGAVSAFRERMPVPRDRWIARAVADALGAPWGPPPPAAAADDAAFYLDIARRYVAPPVAGRSRPEARIRTPHGVIRVELLSDEAPLTVHNFITLAGAGAYDAGVWHRVVPNFVLQDGAPGGDPTGGPGWAIRDEINRFRYHRGVMGMALSGPDTGGSQWFITHSPQPHLDGGYTVFGQVIDGHRAMDRVVQGDPVEGVTIRW